MMHHPALFALTRWKAGSALLATCLAGWICVPTASAAEAVDYYPPASGVWETVSPKQAGFKIDRLVDALQFAGERGSSGVVVLYQGRILAEKYWDRDPPMFNADGDPNPYYAMRRGTDSAGHVIEDVASIQKSVVAVLTGIAQHQGLVQLSDPVQKHLGSGWSKAPRDEEAKITLRHLLTMTSGLDANLNFQSPAGTVWRYNTTAYAQSLRALAAAAEMDHNELTRQWLTGRIGMADSKWVPRPWVEQREVAANRFGFACTARDLARFGLLVLRDGRWNKVNVVEDFEFLEAACQPSQKLNPSYGYLWWLNGQSHVLRGRRLVAGPLIAEAPADLVAGLGALGRKLYVVPSLDLVVTRLGDNPEISGQPAFQSEFCRRLFASAPSR